MDRAHDLLEGMQQIAGILDAQKIWAPSLKDSHHNSTRSLMPTLLAALNSFISTWMVEWIEQIQTPEVVLGFPAKLSGHTVRLFWGPQGIFCEEAFLRREEAWIFLRHSWYFLGQIFGRFCVELDGGKAWRDRLPAALGVSLWSSILPSESTASGSGL